MKRLTSEQRKSLEALGLHSAAELLPLLSGLSQDDKRLPEACGLAGELRLRKAVPALLLRVRRSNVPVTWAAGTALGTIRDRRATLPLLDIVRRSKFLDSRQAAIYALQRLHDPRAESALIKILLDKSEEEHTRSLAIEALTFAHSRNPRALDALIEMLGDPSPEMKISALCALCTARNRRVVRATRALVDDPSRCPHGLIVGKHATQHLMRALPHDVLPRAGTFRSGLRERTRVKFRDPASFLQDPSLDEKRFRLACRVAWGSSDMANKAVPALLRWIQRPKASIAWQAARTLANSTDGRAVRPLLEIVRRSKFLPVRQAALYALGELADARAEATLVKVLSNRAESVYTRRLAARALGYLAPKRRTLPALIRATQDPSLDVRCIALCALNTINDPHARAAIREARKDRSRTTKGTAIASLAKKILRTY